MKTSKHWFLLVIFILTFTSAIAGFPIHNVNAQGCIPAPSGLVSWWSGDGNTDDVQHNNDGTLQNDATFDTGKVAQAFSLDGIDDYVLIPDSPTLTVSSLSIDVWLYKNSATPDYKTIVSKYHFDDSNGRIADDSWILYVEPGGQVSFLVYGPNGQSHRGITTNDAVLTPGAWHFVAATFDFQTQMSTVYIDGVEVPATLYPDSSILTAINDSGAPVRIGTDFTRQLNAFWDGSIDEVELFNRALSASEIQDIFNAGSAGKCKTPNYRLPFVGTYYITNGPGCGIEKDKKGNIIKDTGHTGFTGEAIDYGLPFDKKTGQGTPVLATEAGKVIYAGSDPLAIPPHNFQGFGTYVVIEHTDGSRSYYAHLSQIVVANGEVVTKGQFIAYSGDSGKVQDHPHLHFQINDANGKPIPIRVLPTTVWDWNDPIHPSDPSNPCNPKKKSIDGHATGPLVP